MRERCPQVLIIAPHGSYRTAPFIDAARRLDLDVVIVSDGRYALVPPDAEGIHIDLHDMPQSARDLRERIDPARVCAVIGTDDASTELAAHLARELNLPHNPPRAVRTARRKDHARACLWRAGARVPRHWRLDLSLPLAPQIDEVTYPCVVKPVAFAASRGVIRADDASALLAACARIERLLQEAKDPEERTTLLVEAFIPGREAAVEGLLVRGQLRVLAIFDKPDPLDGPYFEETYYITPSRLSDETQRELRARIDEACRAYGLVEGPIHAECRINDDGVWILEVASRTIGGLCGRLLRFGTGFGLEELVLQHAAGRDIVPSAQAGAAGVLMIPIPEAGVFRRVEGIMAAQKVRYIEEIRIQVREGYELVPLPDGAGYLGFIFARAPTPEQAEAALREAHACLRIVVRPLWKAVAT